MKIKVFVKNGMALSSLEAVDYMHPDDREVMSRLFADIKNGRIDNLHREIRYEFWGCMQIIMICI